MGSTRRLYGMKWGETIEFEMAFKFKNLLILKGLIVFFCVLGSLAFYQSFERIFISNDL